MNNIQEILDLAMKRADSAEVYLVGRDETPIEFKFSRLHSLARKHTKGAGLRVVRNGRIGFSSTTHLSKYQELVENALQSARYGQEARFDFPQKGAYRPVKALSQKVRDFPTETGIDEGRKAISMIKARNEEITCEVDIRKSVEKVTLINSAGFEGVFERSTFSYWIEAFLVIDGSFCWIYEGRDSSDLCLATEEWVSSILEKAELAKKVVSLPTKRLPVLFAPQAAVSLLHGLFLGINGKNAQKGSSPLVGRTGELILDPHFSLRDDGNLDYGYRTAPFDGEGTPSQQTPLFEKGVLKGYILDLQTAGMLGENSTGNGSRGFNTQPSPGPTNFVVEPGDWSLEDMVKEVKEGVIVHSVLGGGQSNLLAGDFSLNLSLAYKIEKGEPVGRVKDCMVAGNVYEEFKDGLRIGCEVEEMGGVYTPALGFPHMSLVSKG